eukprot:5203351-Amphidinium_carterae.1
MSPCASQPAREKRQTSRAARSLQSARQTQRSPPNNATFLCTRCHALATPSVTLNKLDLRNSERSGEGMSQCALQDDPLLYDIRYQGAPHACDIHTE